MLLNSCCICIYFCVLTICQLNVSRFVCFVNKIVSIEILDIECVFDHGSQSRIKDRRMHWRNFQKRAGHQTQMSSQFMQDNFGRVTAKKTRRLLYYPKINLEFAKGYFTMAVTLITILFGHVFVIERIERIHFQFKLIIFLK